MATRGSRRLVDVMTVALIVLGIFLFIAIGARLLAELGWRAGTAGLVARLTAPGGGTPPAPYREADLVGLPAPVERYFRAALREGQPLILRARLRQEGEFLARPAQGRWSPFRASQVIATRPPGFVWDASVVMGPALAVRARDGFVAGAGSMVARLAGLIPMIHVEGTPEIASGAFQRYLGEAFLVPTALLPSQGVVWSPLDDTSARATLTAGATTVSLDFHFGPDGLAESVFTADRARLVEGRSVPTPWRGRCSKYEECSGMRVPSYLEAEWLLPEGAQTYFRARVTGIVYELAGPAELSGSSRRDVPSS